MAKSKKAPTWRYTAGTKGVNRVTVYERRDRDTLYIEWWDKFGNRMQRTVETETGTPLLNTTEGRKIAIDVAEAVAKEREQLHNAELAELYGTAPVEMTVEKLLKRLHSDRKSSWSESYTRDQDRMQTWWTSKLGAVKVRRVNASLVNRIAADEAKRRKWSPRTHGAYLRYIVDAFYYAQRELKVIDERDNLSAVRIPSPRSEGKGYTEEEVRALLPALEKVDPRAGWIGHVAWQTGRRLSAIRKLQKRDVLHAEGAAVLRFPIETDKGRKRGEAVVVGRAAELTGELLTKPGRYVLGTEVPSLDVCNTWIRKAEEKAGIPHKDKRAWHGLKRAFVSASKDLRIASKQSGTLEVTLRNVYDQDWIAGKSELAQAMAKML